MVSKRTVGFTVLGIFGITLIGLTFNFYIHWGDESINAFFYGPNQTFQTLIQENSNFSSQITMYQNLNSSQTDEINRLKSELNSTYKVIQTPQSQALNFVTVDGIIIPPQYFVATKITFPQSAGSPSYQVYNDNGVFPFAANLENKRQHTAVINYEHGWVAGFWFIWPPDSRTITITFNLQSTTPSTPLTFNISEH